MGKVTFLTNKEIQEQFQAQLATNKPFVVQVVEFINKAGETCKHIKIAQGMKNNLALLGRITKSGNMRTVVAWAVQRGVVFNANVGDYIKGTTIQNVQYSVFKRRNNKFTDELNANAFVDSELTTMRQPLPVGTDTFAAIDINGKMYPVFQRTELVLSELSNGDIKLWDGETTIHQSELESIVDFETSSESTGTRELAE